MPTGSGDGASARSARLDGFLERIRAGDEAAREAFLRAYAPFALSVASRVAGRFLRLGEDDEANLALMALDEAVRSYRPERGKFLAFAGQVVRRRQIDHFRRSKRTSREIPAGAGLAPDGSDSRPEDAARTEYLVAELAAREREDGEERQQQLLALTQELRLYGFGLDELAAGAPRHSDSRETAKRAARLLANDPAMSEYLVRLRRLPLRELELGSGVGRKSLERHRRYIVAIAVILMGDYGHLAGYVSG